MKQKQNILILLILAIIITGCQPTQEIIQEPVPLKELDLVLGFTPNIVPDLKQTLTTPRPGLRGIRENETITLQANNTEKYVLNRWEITPKDEETYTIYDETYSINMTKNYLVKVFFGCKTDEACNDRFMCEENLCIPSNRMKAPPFTLAYSELGEKDDKEILYELIDELQKIGYIGIRSPTLFQNVNARELDNQVVLAIFEKEAVIILGANSPRRQEEFAVELRTVLENQGLEQEKIKRIRSNLVRTQSLYDIFLP